MPNGEPGWFRKIHAPSVPGPKVQAQTPMHWAAQGIDYAVEAIERLENEGAGVTVPDRPGLHW